MDLDVTGVIPSCSLHILVCFGCYSTVIIIIIIIIIVILVIVFMIIAVLIVSIAVTTHGLDPFSYSVPLNQPCLMSRYSFCSQD